MSGALALLTPGKSSVIVRLLPAASPLAVYGFIPGARVTLLTASRWGVSVRLGGITYALGSALARAVTVRL